MLFVGVMIGLIGGILRTVMPSLGSWAMVVALVTSNWSTNFAIGFLIAESCVGGLGSVVGSAYSPNLSDPIVASLMVTRKKEIVEEAASLYTLFKVVACLGFAILIIFGAESLKMDVWGLSKWVIFLFIIPSCLIRVGSKALLPYILVMGVISMAAFLLIKGGGPSPIYLLFTSVFVIGGNLAGFKPMPRQRKVKDYTTNYRWAFIVGLMSSILIGIPSGIVLDPAGDKDDESLYRENALASGSSEGMGISLFLVGFGSRDALSSTLNLWISDAGKWQAIGILGSVS